MTTGTDLRPGVRGDFEVIRDILADCVGKENAITIEQLALRAGFLREVKDPVGNADVEPDRRRVELVLQLRRGEFARPVLTCGRGVFLATRASEANAYFASMNSRHAAETQTMMAVRAQMKQAGFIQTGPWEFREPPASNPELPWSVP